MVYGALINNVEWKIYITVHGERRMTWRRVFPSQVIEDLKRAGPKFGWRNEKIGIINSKESRAAVVEITVDDRLIKVVTVINNKDPQLRDVDRIIEIKEGLDEVEVLDIFSIIAPGSSNSKIAFSRH
ncbi:hypothetical protein BBF96_03425 [Anoxybacter fermentans]|uniref:Uncharacterized protein n=1 Tax=Anoxybacter fermentans TaxID=1323375 RepID=A0A3Q9HP56_9FIRM|nr:hypothetical protein [Anoxybacter fermentans]AZR72515.1 hypothetical protein BBF96_03425 [Anoxybacter fermentans]